MVKFGIVGLLCAAQIHLGDAFAGGLQPSGTSYVEEALKPYVASGDLPGAICVLEKDGRRETCCVGYADVKSKTPITMDSLYMQCSQTKGFCGVTMAILVEEGKVSLDDPVSKYLPEFKELWVEVSNTNDTRVLKKAKNVMTVRHVMTHMGGFPFELPAKLGRIPGGGWSGGMPIRSVAAEAAAHPLLFEPGTSGKYSNTGLDVGAAIVETVTGEKWDAFLKRRVLDPLGMTNTCFKPTDAQLKGHIELYAIWKDRKPQWIREEQMAKRPYNDAHVFPSAGAGLWTTANDQIKFYHMLMNLGLGDNGVRILKEETVKKVLASPQVPWGNYSLGLTLWDDGWFGHGGAYGTNAGINWKTKELKLWVVQQIGPGPRPWGKPREEAENKFFSRKLDNTNLESYTGRTSAKEVATEELFNGRNLEGWYIYLQNRGKNNDPKGVFVVTNGVIHVSGEEFGALVTEREFSDYHLSLEYRFTGGPHFGSKVGWAPDSGILFHSTGPDGGFHGIWMESMEVNLIKGATGDFWGVAMPGSDRISLSARVSGEKLGGKYDIHSENGTETFTIVENTRVCRSDISRDWQDTTDVAIAGNERPMGEWNKVDLYCLGGDVIVYFNGKLVNRGFDAKPRRGRIQLQSEGCPVEFRNIRLAACER